MNAGAVQLSALEFSCSEVVAKLKTAGLTVSRMSVSGWQTGKKKPAPAARAAIAEALKIPVSAWDSDAHPKAGTAAGRDADLVDDHTVAFAPTRPLPTSSLADPTAADLAHDLMTRIQLFREQSEMSDLGIHARKMLAEMEGKAIERYAKLAGQSTSERDLLRSPFFTKVLDEMVAALEKFPDALRALRAALTSADST
jgi:hypothetical protein